ncbi:MAG TPA: SIMPL domain-containing protein [Candidatus Acidoferrales bacterium]|nr:SIMPL domain-containing protein [Candidatus Acidoferrales bacterium]
MSEARPQLFGMLAGLFLAAGLVVSSMLGTAAWVKIKNSQFITVKGSARKSIESDLAIWRGSYVVEAETLVDAQHKILANRSVVEKFLAGAGVTNYSFAAIGIEEERATQKNADGWVRQRTSGYRLSQTVRVESADVDRIERLDSTPLVEQGVLFTADPPQFIYTSVGEAKIEMLAEAAKDARARAEQIAGQGGRSIAQLHDADQGIFQITPQHSTDTSGEGLNDVTSRQKTITAVVTATFLLK